MDTEVLNLDGTHSPAKKSGEAIAYQHRKKGRTSNTFIMTDGRGIPIGIGDIISRNHNDLYDIVTQLSKITKAVNDCGIIVENSTSMPIKDLTVKHLGDFADVGKIVPNVKENTRNRKNTKRGRKREFYQDTYKRRFVNERCFAWIDSFRTLLIRFDTSTLSWKNWHYLAFFLLLLKV